MTLEELFRYKRPGTFDGPNSLIGLNPASRNKNPEAVTELLELKIQLVHACRVIDTIIHTHITQEMNNSVLLSDICDSHYRYAHKLLCTVADNGPAIAIDRFKYFKRYLTVLALESSDPLPKAVLYVSKNTKGVPRPLKYLCRWGTKSPVHKRIMLTISNFVMLVKGPISQDFSAIEDLGPVIEPAFLDGFRQFVEKDELIRKLKKLVKERDENAVNRFGKPDVDDMYATYKEGPNGPSLLHLVEDIRYIADFHPKLLEVIKRLYRIDSNPLLYSLEEALCQPSLGESSTRVGLLVQLREGGGKTRNIALSDFWSNNCLKPTHDMVMSILKSIPNDGTYDQESSFKLFKHKANESSNCYSFDLTSATDRFPRIVQKIVLQCFRGKEFADDWEQLVVGRPYVLPKEYYKVRGKTRERPAKQVSWGVGQPLGTLLSWALFTLTHHLYIKYLANDHQYTNYCVLGDDVGIFSHDVAMRYVEGMKSLGVSINTSKSFQCTKAPVYGEFCKRVFLSDDELSGLSMKLIFQTRKNTNDMAVLYFRMVERWGMVLSNETLSTFIKYLPCTQVEKFDAIASCMRIGFNAHMDRNAMLMLFGETSPYDEIEYDATVATFSSYVKSVDKFSQHVEDLSDTFSSESFQFEGDDLNSRLASLLALETIISNDVRLRNPPITLDGSYNHLGRAYNQWLMSGTTSPLFVYLRGFMSQISETYRKYLANSSMYREDLSPFDMRTPTGDKYFPWQMQLTQFTVNPYTNVSVPRKGMLEDQANQSVDLFQKVCLRFREDLLVNAFQYGPPNPFRTSVSGLEVGASSFLSESIDEQTGIPTL